MKKIIIGSAVNSFILTLVIFTVSFLLMLFSSGEVGYRTTLGEALFFNSFKSDTGTTIINFGAGPNAGIVFLFIFLFIFFVTVILLYILKKNEKN